jgi:alpha-amylase
MSSVSASLLTPGHRIITDRYALPNGANVNACNVTEQTWCGGTWRTIMDNLDYIQHAGFTASEFHF